MNALKSDMNGQASTNPICDPERGCHAGWLAEVMRGSLLLLSLLLLAPAAADDDVMTALPEPSTPDEATVITSAESTASAPTNESAVNDRVTAGPVAGSYSWQIVNGGVKLPENIVNLQRLRD